MESRKYIEFGNQIYFIEDIKSLKISQIKRRDEVEIKIYIEYIHSSNAENLLFRVDNSEEIGRRVYLKCRNAIVNNQSCYLPFHSYLHIKNESEENIIIEMLKTPLEKEAEKIIKEEACN